jgi:hypothetical protein
VVYKAEDTKLTFTLGVFVGGVIGWMLVRR